MTDVEIFLDGRVELRNTTALKAANLCKTQIGDLFYLQSFGLDLAFYLDPRYEIKNAALKTHALQRMSEEYIGVAGVGDETLKYVDAWLFTMDEANNTERNTLEED